MNGFTETLKQVFQLGETEESDNVIDVLKADHRKVEDLFKEFENAETTSEKMSIVKDIITELTVHTTAEEKLVYSLLQLQEDQEEKVLEAFEEHDLVKGLIADLSGFSGSEKNLNAKVKTLSELVKHHVTEEELDLLPKLKDSEVDLEELGRNVKEEKEALKAKPPSLKPAKKVAAAKKAPAKKKTTRAKSAAKTAKSAAVKKAAPKKAKAKKAPAKKAATKKTTAKKTAKKATTKKAVRKPAAKKTAAKTTEQKQRRGLQHAKRQQPKKQAARRNKRA